MNTTTLAIALLLASCATATPDAASPASAREPTEATSTPAADEPVAPCGASTKDWCPSPEGDACGEHANEESCRSDARCVGMPYRGESFVPCEPDGKGFWKNCPAVGCVSKPAD